MLTDPSFQETGTSDSPPLPETVARYLSRLGLPPNLAPTAQTLAELQRRHLDAVPYENLAIMLGRPVCTDPGRTLERIAAGGNAGYCFHHNGAFEVVLRALGFAVERRFGQVRGRTSPRLNHLALPPPPTSVISYLNGRCRTSPATTSTGSRKPSPRPTSGHQQRPSMDIQA